METRDTVKRRKTIKYRFGQKHIDYIRACHENTYNTAEGAVRAGKTVDNVYAFAHELKQTKDKIHLASGSTCANAKLNIGDANGFGLEWIFRGQCRWGKYKDNEALIIKGPDTQGRTRIVIFAGGAKADSFKRIRGNSYGMWIATEINLHHNSFIEEAFNRTAAAVLRKFFWDLNPDHPKAPIYKKHIDSDREKHARGELLGGYNYQHFTIHDNITISEERRAEIISKYDKASIWYKRDILGQRCVAEGLIYRTFADHQGEYEMVEKPKDLQEIIVGVDFGGNGSGHAFVATGITRGYEEIVVLASEWHDAEGSDPDMLGRIFVDFCQQVITIAGSITAVYADSAEQVLIRGLRKAAGKAGLGWMRIDNALKEAVNERINFTARLIAQRRLWYLYGCDSFADAMASAVWDPKEETKNVRLDDGTSDIDTLDAFEYTFERYISRFLRLE
ncbi:MAG: PBSX family phage terminase large subunit [Eubacteriaceae bacterium]|nr:PBSX family phage terminase large subunit [Eubacteriaceae bacterium]